MQHKAAKNRIGILGAPNRLINWVKKLYNEFKLLFTHEKVESSTD